MRIRKFQIKNYRSILDSGQINVDPVITILMGKNESGKTCILKALESFSSDYKYTEDDLCLHSEAREKILSEETTGDDIEMVSIWFDIEKKDNDRLQKIMPKLRKIKTLQAIKHYDNSYEFISPGVDLGQLKVSKDEQLRLWISNIINRTIQLRETLDNHVKRHPPFGNSKPKYEELLNTIMVTEHDIIDKLGPILDEIFEGLKELPGADAQIKEEIDDFIKEVNDIRNRIEEHQPMEEGVQGDILEVLPNFVYFADIEKLQDSVPIADFLADEEAYKTLSNLIELSGLDVERVKDSEPYDRLSKLQSASATITGMVNQSWKQEQVDVNVNILEAKLVISIFDSVIRQHHAPSIRSQGFQWFLSFYINFKAGSRGEYKNTILLLDDPGVYLHPSGQKDLLNTLEEISKKNQFVLSTHSPFMIDRGKLDRTRIVCKREEKGTVIEEKYHDSDFDALQPIRASIGMTIGDTLFTTKRNLLVEGYSDELIICAMSEACSQQGKSFIETGKISILPVGGADKMPYFALILKKENLNFLALLDHDPEGRKIARELKEKHNISEENILTLGALGDEGVDLVIENLIGFPFYLKALNLAYRDIFLEKIGKESIGDTDLRDSSFKGITKFFREKKIGGSKRMDKILVAKKIYNLIAEGEVPDRETVSRFSRLSQMINEKVLSS